MPSSNPVIQTSTKVTREQWQRNLLDVMVAEGNKLAIAQKKEFKEVAAEDVAKSAAFVAATPGFSEDDRLRFVSNYISPFSQFDPNNLPEPRKVEGLTKVDLNSPNFAKVAGFAVQKPDQTSGDPANPPAPQFVTLKEAFGGKELIYMQVSVTCRSVSSKRLRVSRTRRRRRSSSAPRPRNISLSSLTKSRSKAPR